MPQDQGRDTHTPTSTQHHSQLVTGGSPAGHPQTNGYRKYGRSLKQEGTLTHTATWTSLEYDVALSVKSQTQEDRHGLIPALQVPGVGRFKDGGVGVGGLRGGDARARPCEKVKMAGQDGGEGRTTAGRARRLQTGHIRTISTVNSRQLLLCVFQ